MKDLLQNGTLVTVIGLVAGVLTAFSMLPQLLKTLKEKKAENVSPVMLVVLILGVVLWLLYGVLKSDLPIILTNGVSVVLNIFMLVLRWKYRNKG